MTTTLDVKKPLVTHLRDDTRWALFTRPAWLTLEQISKETGLKVAWLRTFQAGGAENPGVVYVETLAAYLQALCRHLLERKEAPPLEDDYLVYTYNRFPARRF